VTGINVIAVYSHVMRTIGMGKSESLLSVVVAGLHVPSRPVRLSGYSSLPAERDARVVVLISSVMVAKLGA
jgi:hypothetical protein